MTATAGKQVSIEYTLTVGNDEVVESNVGDEPMNFVLGNNQIIPGLENALEGMAEGESKQVEIAPEEGYGHVISEAKINVPVEQLPESVREVGALVQGQGSEGEMMRGEVVDIEEENATVDFNHPLAGKTLYFDVKVLSVEE